MRLEVCIDNLESAQNALAGGADELELCSILTEGGLTPSPGLVREVIRMTNQVAEEDKGKQEMETMLSDIEFFKAMDIDAFVFGALTKDNNVDIDNCKKVIAKAYPFPVTFHRAFDVCVNPQESIRKIIELGFKRLLTSGQRESVNEPGAKQTIQTLILKHANAIEIMPGSGVSYMNVEEFVKLGCKIVHSSCKITKQLNCSDIKMGSPEIYITDTSAVKKIKDIGSSFY